jgi:hypothetical protein
MSVTALQTITLRTPQFAADARLNDMIIMATQLTSATAFGANTQYAIALRVMHWLTMEAVNGGIVGNSGIGRVGYISSESEGQLSRSFGVSGGFAERYPDLSGTIYGAELVALMRGTIFGPRNRTIEVGQ